MKKMVLTKGIVLGLLLSFPLMAGASENAAPEHDTHAPAVHETGHAAPAEHMAVGHDVPVEHAVDGHAMQEEHAAPAHGEEAGHGAAPAAHGEAAAGDHGGGHHGPILSGVTDPIGTGFLTYMFIMTIFIIPIAVHYENKKHAHGHDDAHDDDHGDAHGGHDAHGGAPGHDDAHHVDSGHGADAHGGH